MVYCRNCYAVSFNPSMVNKAVAFRGAIMALEADKNCYYKGAVEVSMQGLTVDETISLYDGGGLVYSKTDCFLQLTLNRISTSNTRSNYILGQPGAMPVVVTNAVSDADGGSIIRVLANSIKLNIINSTLRDARAMNGLGGLFNLISNDVQGTLINNTISTFGSRAQGGLLYVNGPTIFMNIT
jgi:hypothetical protein